MKAKRRAAQPWHEALLISAYALVLNTAALAAGLLLFLGREAMATYMGFAGFLLVLASIAVFGTAFAALRRAPICTPQRGLRLGLIAAAIFYALILIPFGLIPSLVYLPSGNVPAAAGYLGDVIWITMAGSYGLPVLTGALGGAAYGWLRRKAAAA